jgi:recombination protein RecA
VSNFDEFLAGLNPDIRKKAQIAADLKDEYLELPSIGLTKALDGGWKYGAQHMLWGGRSGGKTMLALQAIAKAQQDGKTCAFVDAEGSYTTKWGEKLGINNKELLLLTGQKTIGGVTDQAVEYIKGGVDFLLVDSIGALVPGSYFGKDDELKDFDSTNQMGQHAREIGKMSVMFNLVNEKTLIVLISQITMNLSGMVAMAESQGGKKAGHINTSSIKLLGQMAQDKQITGTISDGDRIYTKPIGRPINWTIDKDRGPGMGLKGSYDLYFDGDFVGIDTIGEIVDYGVAYGLIEQKGAWFFIGDEKYQGRTKLVAELRSEPELAERLRKEIVS